MLVTGRSVCGGSDRCSTGATDRGADQRVEARDRAQQGAAAGADRTVGQCRVPATISAAAECDSGGQAENNCDRLQHDPLQIAWPFGNAAGAEKFRSNSLGFRWN
jgi:hypothetical protein